MSKPNTDNERNLTRTQRNTAAGLTRISPSHWVLESERDAALEDIKRVLAKYKKRARKQLDDYYAE